MRLTWRHLNGSIAYCPQCDPIGERNGKHLDHCPTRKTLSRYAVSDAVCAARIGEAVTLMARGYPTSSMRPAEAIAACSRPVAECIAAGWALPTGQGWICTRHPHESSHVPKEARVVYYTDSDGTVATCAAYRPGARPGGVGRKKTPKRDVPDGVPIMEGSDGSRIIGWLRQTLQESVRNGQFAARLLADTPQRRKVSTRIDLDDPSASSLLHDHVRMGQAASAALAGCDYDPALDRRVLERMRRDRPWAR